MNISDEAVRAIEQGAPVESYDIAVKTEEIQGKKFFSIGFTEMWVWHRLLSTAHPELRETILAAIQKFGEAHSL